MSHHVAAVGDTFWGGGCEALEIGYLLWCRPFGYLRDRILHGEAHFYQSMLIQGKSYHDDYVYSFGKVIVSGGDGMDSSTQVLVASGSWVPAVLSYHTRH
jgi:hypothetical protein